MTATAQSTYQERACELREKLSANPLAPGQVYEDMRTGDRITLGSRVVGARFPDSDELWRTVQPEGAWPRNEYALVIAACFRRIDAPEASR